MTTKNTNMIIGGALLVVGGYLLFGKKETAVATPPEGEEGNSAFSNLLKWVGSDKGGCCQPYAGRCNNLTKEQCKNAGFKWGHVAAPTAGLSAGARRGRMARNINTQANAMGKIEGGFTGYDALDYRGYDALNYRGYDALNYEG